MHMKILRDILKKILRDDLARDALVMFLGSGFMNFFNLLYSLFLLRTLAPADFGLFNSLLSLFVLFSQFPSTLSFVMTRFISRYHAQGNLRRVREVTFSFGNKILGIGAVTFILLILLRMPLGRFLKVPNSGIFFILSATVLSVYLGIVPSAALHGLQKFPYLSSTSIIGGLTKLILVVIFVRMGWGVGGALSAFLASNTFTLLLYAYFLKRSLCGAVGSQPSLDRIDFQEMYRYFLPVFLMSLASVTLLNVDVILVRNLFSPINAGFYSIAQVVGKIVIFFPGAIVTVMFPKVASLQARDRDTRFILKKSLVYIFVLSGTVALLAMLFPAAMLNILARRVYPECIPLVRMFCVNMTLLSMSLVFLNYYLSLNARKYLYSFLATVILEIILISLFHQSLIQVLGVIFVCFSGLLIFNLWAAFRKNSLIV